uniref:Uncharacterized protein LOC111103664 isoform X4 n=1 Tax=Crassostrea virginica TaxID=6565 RepID=A0A8B8ARH9_CRAVI|nr:uncharacterized protein LOC111103664 isoform X4 [Crassostrea virginica]
MYLNENEKEVDYKHKVYVNNTKQKCTEFNSLGKLIQASVINCSDALVTCPNAYRSTEMYKYQACYDVVYQSTRNEEAHCSSRSTEGKSHLGIAVGLSRRWDVYIW